MLLWNSNLFSLTCGFHCASVGAHGIQTRNHRGSSLRAIRLDWCGRQRLRLARRHLLRAAGLRHLTVNNSAAPLLLDLTHGLFASCSAPSQQLASTNNLLFFCWVLKSTGEKELYLLKLRISRFRRSSEVLLGSTYPLPLARHCMCKQPNNILYLLIRSKSFSNGFAVIDLVMWTFHLSGSYQTHLSRDSLHLNLDGLISCKSCMFLFYVTSTSFYEVSYTVSLKLSHFYKQVFGS